jgi:hypothetical protein
MVFRLMYNSLKDVGYRDKKSYRTAARAKVVEQASSKLMNEIEPTMGHAVENPLMAQRIADGNAPRIPMYRETKANPLPCENRKPLYKSMRLGACREF